MMNAEFKNDVLKIKANNPQMDYIDAMIEKFNDYVKEDGNLLQFLEEFDERCFLIRLFGNYHYQVNNGGHAQYFDNGYASRDDYRGGCFGCKTNECDLHQDLIDLVKKYFPQNETSVKFVSILERFLDRVEEEDCGYCDGNGYTEEEYEVTDEDGNTTYESEEITCCECHGSGTRGDDFCVRNANDLDDEYYDIEDSVLKLFNSVVEHWLTSDTDCALNEFQNAVNLIKNTSEKVPLKLVGTDGNAFAIMGKVINALKEQKVPTEKINQYKKDATSGDYNNLLAVSLKYCDEANIEVC